MPTPNDPLLQRRVAEEPNDPFTEAQRESIAAMRDQQMTDDNIAMVVAIARLHGFSVGEVALTYLVARDQLAGKTVAGVPVRLLSQSDA